ncbi:MAG: putative quinol monooxygenase [Cyclobacteriaceae bacterium]
MFSALVQFEVKKQAIDQALVLVRDFVNHVRSNEPETLFYHCIQSEDNPCEFVLMMAFANEAAEERHQESEKSEDFGEKLLLLCTKDPEHQLFSTVI